MSAEVVKPTGECVGIDGNKPNLKAAVTGTDKVNP